LIWPAITRHFSGWRGVMGAAKRSFGALRSKETLGRRVRLEGVMRSSLCGGGGTWLLGDSLFRRGGRPRGELIGGRVVWLICTFACAARSCGVARGFGGREFFAIRSNILGTWRIIDRILPQGLWRLKLRPKCKWRKILAAARGAIFLQARRDSASSRIVKDRMPLGLWEEKPRGEVNYIHQYMYCQDDHNRLWSVMA
jgi:hypothetical protein